MKHCHWLHVGYSIILLYIIYAHCYRKQPLLRLFLCLLLGTIWVTSQKNPAWAIILPKYTQQTEIAANECKRFFTTIAIGLSIALYFVSFSHDKYSVNLFRLRRKCFNSHKNILVR